MKNFGINGFGRIGRTSFRVWWLFHRDNLALKAINTSGSMEIEDWANLLKYDSNYGRFETQGRHTSQPPLKIEAEVWQTTKNVSPENPVLGKIVIIDPSMPDPNNPNLPETHKIFVTAQRDPALIPWAKMGVEVVIESTGAFTDYEKASKHLQGGANRIIISAPAKDEQVSSTVIGIKNGDPINPVWSNASCTTNCIAPIMKIISEKFGVTHAMLNTIHSYTDDQNLHDNSHKDMRRARAGAENICPTSTGAAKAVAEVIPELKGKFDGLSVRVPTPVGSLSDVTIITKKPITKELINQTLIEASQQINWQGILATSTDPLVSSDIIGRRESSIVDLSLTQVMGENMVKIIAWYDNEFGYCNRLVEQVKNA